MREKSHPGEASRRIYRPGDAVRIKAGPFSSFTGKIEGINQAKRLLKVRVTIFGREAQVKLYYTDVERISLT